MTPWEQLGVRRRVRNLLWALGDRLCLWAGAGSDAAVRRPWRG